MQQSDSTPWVCCSIWNNHDCEIPPTVMQIPWSGLTQYLSSVPEVQSKSACPVLKLSTFGARRTEKGCYRHDQNVTQVYGIEIDYDGGIITPDDACKLLEKYQIRGFIYTSYNHTPSAPKWRILLPLSKPVDPGNRIEYAEAINGLFSGNVDYCSAGVSQIFYYGKRPGSEYRTLITFDDPDEGFCIDEVDDWVTWRQPFQKLIDENQGYRTRDESARLARQARDLMKSGKNVHDSATFLTARWVAKGLSDEEIRDFMQPIANDVAKSRGSDRADTLMGEELNRMIEGARKKGYSPFEIDFSELLASLQEELQTPAADSTGLDVCIITTQAIDNNASCDPPAYPAEEYFFPRHLLDVPGIVGDVADYILSTSLFPQPVLALAASLAWCGTIMGRKVCTPTNIRSNLYAIGVADSGSGKEHARKAIKKIALAAEMTKYVGAEKLASDQGVFAMLSINPSCLALLDEFGRTLRVLNDERAAPHLQQLVTILMELFGSADSFIIEKLRAEHTTRAPRIITAPNLCIYATTVPGRLYQGLTPDEIIDGFLPRFLVFESDTPDPVRCAGSLSGPSGALLDLHAQWKDETTDVDSHGNLSGGALNAPVNPRIVSIDAAAESVFNDFETYANGRKKDARGTGIDAMWARACEHALRLALIRGAGDQGVIDYPTAAWACELAGFLVSRTATQAQACVAHNAYEGDVQKVQAFIRSQGTVTLSDLTRKFRNLKTKERDGILSALMDGQQVEKQVVVTSGRAAVRLVWIG